LKPIEKYISFEELNELLQSQNPSTLIDVRNKSEPKEGHIGGLWIPLDSLEEQADSIPADRMIVLYCRSGRRSAMAASILKSIFPDADIRCLKQQP